MINIHNVTVTFGGENLFSGITFKLNSGDRVGLVGKNGAGKSTLLKVLSKDMEHDGGTLAFDKDVKIGFLRQDIDFVKGRTILEEAYQAFTEIKELERQLEKINNELVSRTDYESEGYNDLIVSLNEITVRYELLGGYNYKGDTEKILQGLGFKRSDFDKLTDTFSGGWRMRIELAKLLLQKNDILLLDEPTNHLDIESIIWLEGFLRSFSGVVVLVSHDKMFLDNVTNRTIEISLGSIYDYKKPYSQYLVLRKELREQQLQTQKNQEKEIKQTEQLIEKFRAKANKASMAQSLIKKLDRVERIEVDVEDNSVMSVQFPLSKQSGKIIVTAEKVSKSYGDHKILHDIDLIIERGSKIAFVGQNGQGKSTLAKIIIGELEYEGDFKLGHNVEIGYFAQNQAEYLDGEKTLLQTMEESASDGNRVKVRDMLGSFLFSGDDVEKKVKVLSGGERNRLALCKMLLEPFNVLVMDEPTNHLDIASKNVLKKALLNFEGTLILVSHDRDFLQGLTSKVLGFKDQEIKEYLGDIDYFLEAHKLENLREAEMRTKQSEEKDGSKKEAYQAQKASGKELRQMQNKVSKIEREISKLELEVEQEDKKLAENFEEVSKDPTFFEKYEAKKKKVENLMEEWELLEEKIAEIQA